MKKAKIMFFLLLAIAIPVRANDHDTRTKGLVVVSALLASGGIYLLCRRSYSKIDKICEIIGGSVLLAAGVAGIVLSGDISHKIEQLYHK